MFSRALLPAVLSLLVILPATAQQPPGSSPPKKKPAAAAPKAAGPQRLGNYDDWTAATHQEAGQPVCYAFTRAQSSIPELPSRNEVVLTVTQRSSGRDSVAIEAGYVFALNATVSVQADQAGLDFYTHQRAAFARDGHAAVAAFQHAGRAIARSPGPKDATVTDTFSLKGFSAAYAAISKACPSK